MLCGTQAYVPPCPGLGGPAALALGRRGKIVVLAGRSDPDDSVLLRFRPGGSLDRSFSGDGFLNLRRGSGWWGSAITLDRRGRIVVGGQYVNTFFRGPSEIIRATRRGRVDPRFTVHIRRTVGIGGLATDRMGRIVALASLPGDDDPGSPFAVARILSD